MLTPGCSLIWLVGRLHRPRAPAWPISPGHPAGPGPRRLVRRPGRPVLPLL